MAMAAYPFENALLGGLPQLRCRAHYRVDRLRAISRGGCSGHQQEKRQDEGGGHDARTHAQLLFDGRRGDTRQVRMRLTSSRCAYPCRWRKMAKDEICPDRFPRMGQMSRSGHQARSEEHTSELPSLMRISYAVFCLKKKK